MMSKAKNSYLKLIMIMLVGALIGGIIGGGGYYFFGREQKNIADFLSEMVWQIQNFILPILIGITIISIILREYSLRKMNIIPEKIYQSDDEECDIWEYEEEKMGAFGLNVNVLTQVLSILVLSMGYSANYLEMIKGNINWFLYGCIVFLLCNVYNGVWQIRYVKLIQKINPDKKGDPTSRKFQQQWLESCDEAEREVIYQSSYKMYMTLAKILPLLLFITMISNLLFNTGIFAIIVVALIWLISSVSYTHSCVTLKGKRL